MNCEEIKKLIINQIDSDPGMTHPETAIFIEKHIKKCPACAKERESLLSYKKLMADNFTKVTVPELSADFSEKFYQRLEKEKKVPLLDIIKEEILRTFRFPALVPAACAGLVLVLLVVFGMKSRFITKYMEIKQPEVTTYSSALIEVAINQTQKIEQQEMVAQQSKELLKNFL